MRFYESLDQCHRESVRRSIRREKGSPFCPFPFPVSRWTGLPNCDLSAAPQSTGVRPPDPGSQWHREEKGEAEGRGVFVPSGTEETSRSAVRWSCRGQSEVLGAQRPDSAQCGHQQAQRAGAEKGHLGSCSPRVPTEELEKITLVKLTEAHEGTCVRGLSTAVAARTRSSSVGSKLGKRFIIT